MELVNSASIEIPKLVHFGHPPIETENVGNLLNGIVVTRIDNSNGVGGAQTGTIEWRIRMILKL